MMKRIILLSITLILAISSGFLLYGCASTPTHESTGQYIDNSALTAKIKAQLLADESIGSLAISVKSYKGHVELSGFVNNVQQQQRALQIARNVKGVVSVKNALIIKAY